MQRAVNKQGEEDGGKCKRKNWGYAKFFNKKNHFYLELSASTHARLIDLLLEMPFLNRKKQEMFGTFSKNGKNPEVSVPH